MSSYTIATVSSVQVPEGPLMEGVTRLGDDVIDALKQHYGPYYCDSEGGMSCIWGPGPIPYYLQPVYNCTLGMPSGKHNYNNERAIHISKYWLNNLPDRLFEAKQQYKNTLQATLVHYYPDNIHSWMYRNPTITRNGDNYVFTFAIKDDLDIEALAKYNRLRLNMKWDTDKGYSVKKTKLYVNGSLFKERNHEDLHVTKRSYDSSIAHVELELYDLLDYKERIVELRYEVEGVLSTSSNLFELNKLEERIRPFYEILKREAEAYFEDVITLEECMLALKQEYLALPR